MIEVSDDYIASLWLEEPEPEAVLLTIAADGITPIRVVNYEGRLSGTVDTGLVSDGDTYQYAPFTVGWVGASGDAVAKDLTLSILGYDGGMETAVDAIGANTLVTCDLKAVRISDPDIVERAVVGARAIKLRLAQPEATATIRPRDFSTEPACQARATHARVPAMY